MDELVKRLRQLAEEQMFDFERQPYLQAADAIEQLSNAGSAYGRGWTLGYDAGRDESKPRWIPVEERLPKKQGWCVACVFYRGIQWGDITTKGFTSVCPAYYFEGTFHKVSSEAEVTHWMPLPEPPEEGET